MSSEKAKRVSSTAHIYQFINDLFKETAGIDPSIGRWNRPVSEDVWTLVSEFEKVKIFDIDPARQSRDDLPATWRCDVRVKPRHFNDWFNLEYGTGKASTTKLQNWLIEKLQEAQDPLTEQEQHEFDLGHQGVEELDEDEDVGQPCEECGVASATLVCVWCYQVYYCSMSCRGKNGGRHVTRSSCPGPVEIYTRSPPESAAGEGCDGEDNNSGQSEAQLIRSVVEQVSRDFTNGVCDCSNVEELIQRLESDEYLDMMCQIEIQYLYMIVDQLAQAPNASEFEPNDLFDDNGVDEFGELTDFELNELPRFDIGCGYDSTDFE